MGLELAEGVAQRADIVVQPEDLHVVAEVPERRLDVVAGLERLDLFVGELLDLVVAGRDQPLVHRDQDAALLHIGIHSRS